MATTTCCILLLDRENKDSVSFFNLSSIDELEPELLQSKPGLAIQIDYNQLSAYDKWRAFINQEEHTAYNNLLPVSQFCSVTRGIATGANDYFCFSLKKAAEHSVPEHCLTKCICRSADVKTPFFTDADFDLLSASDKAVYVLDVTENEYDDVKQYIETGEKASIDKKYLPSCRTPWYSMEQKRVAPIWVSSACRNGIKFVRNLTQAKALTTFHSIFISEDFIEYTDLIFCYFLTPIAQTIIRENRKELGNGLEKFQPNDLNSAKMLDIRIVSATDRERVFAIYQTMLNNYSNSYIEELNTLFSNYIR